MRNATLNNSLTGSRFKPCVRASCTLVRSCMLFCRTRSFVCTESVHAIMCSSFQTREIFGRLYWLPVAANMPPIMMVSTFDRLLGNKTAGPLSTYAAIFVCLIGYGKLFIFQQSLSENCLIKKRKKERIWCSVEPGPSGT